LKDPQQERPKKQEGKRLAFFIPFRDQPQDSLNQGAGRADNLIQWLEYMRNNLPPQIIGNSHVFIIEQTHESGLFNKGSLFNIGFDHLFHDNNTPSFDYMVFHDVDQVPDQSIISFIYDYRAVPTKLIARTTWNYTTTVDDRNVTSPPANERLLGTYDVGGVLMMTPDHYRCTNGFSNIMSGWGGEDDNMAIRINHHISGYRIVENGQFRGLHHPRVSGLDETHQFQRKMKLVHNHSFSGMNDLLYSIVKTMEWDMEGWPVTRLLVHPENVYTF
jgi:hypothetical protein